MIARAGEKYMKTTMQKELPNLKVMAQHFPLTDYTSYHLPIAIYIASLVVVWLTYTTGVCRKDEKNGHNKTSVSLALTQLDLVIFLLSVMITIKSD